MGGGVAASTRAGQARDPAPIVAGHRRALALVIAWSANLYNFMDGTDGLAGAMGAVGFAALRASPPRRDRRRALRAAPAFFALAAAIVPFLVVNRPRGVDVPGRRRRGAARASSRPLFGVGGVARRLWPAWFPLLVFLPFIADATLTLARARAAPASASGRRTASHYYQRLHQLGAGHGGTLAVYASAMVGTAATALGCRALGARRRLVRRSLRGLLSCCMLFAAIDYHWRRRPTSRATPMTHRSNWRASLAFVHDVCTAAIAWVGMYWLRFNLDLREPFVADMRVHARVDPAAAGGDLPGARPVSRACGASRACSTCSASCSPRGSARS